MLSMRGGSALLPAQAGCPELSSLSLVSRVTYTQQVIPSRRPAIQTTGPQVHGPNRNVGSFPFTASKGNEPTLRFGPWTWGPVVWMAGRREGITCWVYVTLDTRLSEFNSGQPACAGNSALPPRIDSMLRGETPPTPARP